MSNINFESPMIQMARANAAIRRAATLRVERRGNVITEHFMGAMLNVATGEWQPIPMSKDYLDPARAMG